MTEQIIAYGATVERSVNGTTWTPIPECKGVAVPATQRDYIDATNLDSPDASREYIRGLKDHGEITLPCGYTASGYEQQLADEAAVAPIYYRTTLAAQPSQSAGDVFQFRGYPTVSVEGDDVAGIVGMTITIRTTGAVTWTRGAAAA